MSEWKLIDCEMNDEECLLEALKEVGYQAEVHENGTTDLENNYSSKRPKAHIVVRRRNLPSGCYSDLGFERTKDGMKIHADDTDYSHNRDRIKLGSIKQSYADRVIHKMVKRRPGKFSIKSRKKVDGEIKIVVRRL